MITFKKYTEIVSKIAKKFDVSRDVAVAALIKAQQKGIDPLKWQKYASLLNTFIRIMIKADYDPRLKEEHIVEQVEAESILKYYPSPREVKFIRSIRHKLIQKNPDMKPIGDDKLHITLAGGPGWKKISSEFKGVKFDNPDFQLEFEEPKKIESSGRISWYMKVKQQRKLKDYVTDLLQSDPDPKRVFHVSIANKTGKVGDSVANI